MSQCFVRINQSDNESFFWPTAFIIEIYFVFRYDQILSKQPFGLWNSAGNLCIINDVRNNPVTGKVSYNWLAFCKAGGQA